MRTTAVFRFLCATHCHTVAITTHFRHFRLARKHPYIFAEAKKPQTLKCSSEFNFSTNGNQVLQAQPVSLMCLRRFYCAGKFSDIQHASVIHVAVGRLGKLFGTISPDPPRYPVAQIEPMSCQAVNCGQFCLQRSPDRQPRLAR